MESKKLYKCPDYGLLVYPTREQAKSVVHIGWSVAAAPDRSAAAVDYWSQYLGCKVNYSKPNELFMCLKTQGQFAYVLFGEIQGWITTQDWLNILEQKLS